MTPDKTLTEKAPRFRSEHLHLSADVHTRLIALKAAGHYFRGQPGGGYRSPEDGRPVLQDGHHQGHRPLGEGAEAECEAVEGEHMNPEALSPRT